MINNLMSCPLQRHFDCVFPSYTVWELSSVHSRVGCENVDKVKQKKGVPRTHDRNRQLSISETVKLR